MARLKQFWTEIKDSFWFTPAVVILILIIIALGVIKLDHTLAASKGHLPFELISLEQASIRIFLSTIAGSMMTIAGVVFSITILVLAQTAGQYTSRILRNFMRKKTNQMILGVFVGIFIFCLFLITNVHPTDNALTTLSGFVLALLGVGFLIYYIHQISISIQATEILRDIQEETSAGIDRLYPETFQDKKPHEILFEVSHSIFSNQTGFLQAIDQSTLFNLAIKYQTRLKITKKVGDFIAKGEEIGLIEKDLVSDEQFIHPLHQSLLIGKYRTAAQDVGYGIQQLTDIALRGLSKGINDLSTAITSIDYLSAIFIQLANRNFGDPIQYYENRPILFVRVNTFSSFLEVGYKAIAANIGDQPTIQESLKSSFEKIKKATDSDERKAQLNYYMS